MMYNPIFEEELEREKQIRDLKESITYRATREQLSDLGHQALHFAKSHPILTVLALGVFGLGFRTKS